MRSRPRSLPPALLCSLLLPSLLAAQQLPPRLPAAPPPPEVQRVQQMREQLEQLQKGERALPAPATPAPEQQAIERLRQQLPQQAATPPRAPTRDELLQRLRELPGGPERLEEAKKRGAPIPDEASATTWLTTALKVIAWINPLRVETAHSQTTFNVSLTPTSAYTPNAWVHFIGGDVYAGSETSRYLNTIGGWTSATNPVAPPNAILVVTVPKTGWYIINFNGWAWQTKASLWHWGGNGYQSVWSWDYSTKYQVLAFPAMLELTQGMHSFLFKVETGWVAPSVVQIMSFP
jgi:hypothetical protein